MRIRIVNCNQVALDMFTVDLATEAADAVAPTGVDTLQLAGTVLCHGTPDQVLDVLALVAP